eukprot:scaffold7218_cov613-Prasinococcus_capsulatus_cf.AAC.3
MSEFHRGLQVSRAPHGYRRRSRASMSGCGISSPGQSIACPIGDTEGRGFALLPPLRGTGGSLPSPLLPVRHRPTPSLWPPSRSLEGHPPALSGRAGEGTSMLASAGRPAHAEASAGACRQSAGSQAGMMSITTVYVFALSGRSSLSRKSSTVSSTCSKAAASPHS